MEFTNCDRCPLSSGCELQQGGERCVEKLVRMLRVEMEEKGVIERRLKHLLQSEYIARFDKVNPETHEYERNINAADIVLKLTTAPAEGKTIPVYFICDKRKCDVCGGDCKRTTDFRHAENFVINAFGALEEKE